MVSKFSNILDEQFKPNNDDRNSGDDDIKKVVKSETSSSNFPNQMRPGVPNSRDLMETCIIKNLISSYYHVVKKNICDLVPKTIMCLLVNQSKISAEKEMISQLYNSHELETLFEEDPIVEKRRKQCVEALSNLKESVDILMEIRDLNFDN